MRYATLHNSKTRDILLHYIHKYVYVLQKKLIFRGAFTNYVENILAFFFDHLPPCVDIFYGMNVEKKWTFLDHLPKDGILQEVMSI